MMNTIKESKIAESNNIQMEPVAVTEMGQPSEVPPPFTFSAGGSNAAAPATMRKNDMLTTTLSQGSNRNSVRITVVLVNRCEDILEKLLPYAAKEEIFILGATGEVSYVELLNPREAPVANTSLQGNFEISSLEGNIMLPKKHNKKSKNTQVTVLVAGNDNRIRGGPVRSLIAKSPVQVIISTMSKYGMQHMACKEYSTANKLSPLVDQSKHMTQVVDRIYKATLKELNEINTHGHAPIHNVHQPK